MKESDPTIKKEFNIDIGGGAGEYFTEEAKKNPDKTFVVLEPFSRGKVFIPQSENLHVIMWKSDVDSSLPFLEGTVSVASANFLMGELQTKEGNPRTIEVEKRRYARLMGDIKNLLKEGGKLRIVEVKGSIDYVVEILNEVGFSVTSQPRPISSEEKDMSFYTKFFYDMYKKSGKKPEDSVTLPMVLEATK
jgi:hypothetical protein